jgi:hypothetical protein
MVDISLLNFLCTRLIYQDVLFAPVKKAFSFPLNWIYAGIVGAAVLMLTVIVVSNMQKSASYAIVSDVKIYADNAFKNIQLNHKTDMSFDLPSVNIIMSCDTFSVDNAESSTLPISDNIIFSPDMLKTKILGYSYVWRVPFETEYFTYVTSPGVRYVFIDSVRARELYDIFPDVNKGFADAVEERNYGTRYISFSGNPGIENSVYVELLHDHLSFPDSFGKVTYDDGNSVHFMDRATLFGALYSQDSETYDCNMKKAMKKLSIIARMKKDKIVSIAPRYGHCPYGSSIEILESMILRSESMETTYTNMKRIFDLSKELKKENMMLQRLSCPMIY